MLAAGLAAALLLAVVSANLGLPHRRRANSRRSRSAFASAAQQDTASVSAAQPKTRLINSLAATTKAAAAHAGIVQGRRKAKVPKVGDWQCQGATWDTGRAPSADSQEPLRGKLAQGYPEGRAGRGANRRGAPAQRH